MTIFDGAILGLVQGLTEFIPVSSSGHLIIARALLHIPETGLAFDAVLQLATALAVTFYFRTDLIRIIGTALRLLAGRQVEEGEKTLVYALVVGTIPAVIAGLLLEKYMDTVFRDVRLVAATLLFGSIIMWLAEYMQKQRVYEEALTPMKGFVIGLFQCLALAPGVSRSGATISGGLFSGLGRENAARLSFLLSVPILLGTGAKKLLDIIRGKEMLAQGSSLSLLVGFIISFCVGFVVIHYFMKFLKKYPLDIFIWYRVLLAIALVVWFV